MRATTVMRYGDFLLLLYAVSVATAEAKDVDLHIVAVPAKDSGLTHKVEIQSVRCSRLGSPVRWPRSLMSVLV